MSNPVKDYYKVKAEGIIKNLKKRDMEGFYCENKETAIDKIFSLLEEGTTISWGGSMTIQNDLDLHTKLRKKNFNLLDRSKCNTPEELKELYRKAFTADYFFMSTNAITKDGELINIDGIGNRVASLCYGPDNVIVVAGMNKVVNSVDEGINRIRNIASPMNSNRLDRNSPCRIDGNCHNCTGKNSLCSHIVVTRSSMQSGRIKVILIGENLGY